MNLFKQNNCSIFTRLLSNKNYATSTKQVRVRFAPSPTGKLHIGGLRTALYNYLFARKYNGHFILRIEDTDQDRFKADSVSNIIESLRWTGLEPDFAPYKQDQNNVDDLGPLLQSKRLSLYQTYAKILLDSQKAYVCFCDETRLELLRKNAAKRQEKQSYDGKCRHLTPKAIEQNLANDLPYVIRFKLENKDVSFEDMTSGLHTSCPAKVEGDFVIIKSDKFPTYHFANVVDDHLMQITHVLRGLEWQLSTAKHILLYEAFGWKHPVYAHLPLICNMDGTKISKRQNDIDVLSFRERGYLPEALLTYLSTIGGGGRTNVAESEAFFNDFHQVRQNLVNNFDETKMINRPVKLNQELLDNMNRRFMKSKFNTDDLKGKMIDELRNSLKLKYTTLNDYYLSEYYLSTVLQLFFDRVYTTNDLVNEDKYSYLWTDASNLSVTSNSELKDSSDLVLEIIESIKAYLQKEQNLFVEEKLKSDLTKIFADLKKSEAGKKSETKVKKNNFWKLTRLILIGNIEGPPVAEIFKLLGRDILIYRLNLAKEFISKII